MTVTIEETRKVLRIGATLNLEMSNTITGH